MKQKHKLHLNTSHFCFLCLKTIGDNYSTTCFSSLQNIFRYLNIDLGEINSAKDLNQSDVQVSLCKGCGKTLGVISRLYEALDKIKLDLDCNFETVQKVLEGSKGDAPSLSESYQRKLESTWNEPELGSRRSLRQSELVNELRETILEKCNLKMPNYHPRVNLEKISVEALASSSKAGENTSDASEPLKDIAPVTHSDTISVNIDSVEDATPPSEMKVDSNKTENSFLEEIIGNSSGLSSDSFQSTSSPGHNSNDVGGKKKKRGPYKKKNKEIKQKETSSPKERRKRTNGPGTDEKGQRKLFNCPQCEYTSPFRFTIQRHVRFSHDESRPFKCTECNLCCKTASHLLRHETREHNKGIVQDGKYPCDVCGIYFRRYQLIVHMRTHTGDRPYACDVCDKRFKRPTHLRMHMEYHSKKPYCPYSCSFCKYTCVTHRCIKLHLKTIHGEKPGVSFSYKPEGEGDSSNKSGDETQKPYACKLCPKRFKVRMSLNRHIKSHHLGVQVHHECGYCSITVPYSDLKQHIAENHKDSLTGAPLPVKMKIIRIKTKSDSVSNPSSGQEELNETANNDLEDLETADTNGGLEPGEIKAEAVQNEEEEMNEDDDLDVEYWIQTKSEEVKVFTAPINFL